MSAPRTNIIHRAAPSFQPRSSPACESPCHVARAVVCRLAGNSPFGCLLVLGSGYGLPPRTSVSLLCCLTEHWVHGRRRKASPFPRTLLPALPEEAPRPCDLHTLRQSLLQLMFLVLCPQGCPLDPREHTFSSSGVVLFDQSVQSQNG